MKNVTQNWESPDVAMPSPAGAAGRGPPPAGAKPSPEDLVKKKHG